MVDDETGRGVPLIELRTVNALRYYTDSNGVVAFREPGLMGTDVFFSVAGHGYEYPADGFGIRGVRLHVAAGASATVKIHRKNIAQRLYRLTGGGIYADSVLVEEKALLKAPVLDAPGFRFRQRAERALSRQNLLVLGRHQPAVLSAWPL